MDTVVGIVGTYLYGLPTMNQFIDLQWIVLNKQTTIVTKQHDCLCEVLQGRERQMVQNTTP